RGFVRGAFRRSTYRSFRDEGSRRLALPAGAEPSDAIVPDLAFGLELPGPSAPGRGVVGIAPIVFESPRHWPVKDPVAYAGYTQRLAASLGALVAAGYRYRWLVSDLSDHAAVADGPALLSPDTARGEISHPPITGVPDLIEALSSLSVLVASRLHAILLGYVVGTPAVGLSYDRKVDVLMADFGQERSRLDIRSFAPERVVQAVRELCTRGDDARRSIFRRATEHRASVDHQYRRVLGLPDGAAR